jgi:hypothetical protein
MRRGCGAKPNTERWGMSPASNRSRTLDLNWRLRFSRWIVQYPASGSLCALPRNHDMGDETEIRVLGAGDQIADQRLVAAGVLTPARGPRPKDRARHGGDGSPLPAARKKWKHSFSRHRRSPLAGCISRCCPATQGRDAPRRLSSRPRPTSPRSRKARGRPRGRV